MKVEIWSDVMCPFCYIGKRKFELALKQFKDQSQIEIVWKSFQLMPNIKTNPRKNIDEFLAEEKGIPLSQAKAMNESVIQMAKNVGLNYEMDKTIPSNTMNAHRLIHLAKSVGKQNEMEEALFRAHFIEGKNVDDFSILEELGKEVGLNAQNIKDTLVNQQFTSEINNDIQEARQIGVQGVPFFVFDRKYAVSGAQDEQVFLQVLDKSFEEWKQTHPEIKLDVIEGSSCTVDGNCN